MEIWRVGKAVHSLGLRTSKGSRSSKSEAGWLSKRRSKYISIGFLEHNTRQANSLALMLGCSDSNPEYLLLLFFFVVSLSTIRSSSCLVLPRYLAESLDAK